MPKYCFFFLLSSILCMAYSLDPREYETSILKIMDDDLLRNKRETSGDGAEDCSPGEFNATGSCEKTKQFGGQIRFDGTFQENNSTQKQKVSESIQAIYGNLPGFIAVEILSIRSGSIVVDYLLHFNSSAEINANDIRKWFSEDCNCTAGAPLNCSTDLTVEYDSCTTVIDNNIACKNPSYSGFCDVSSTTCSPGSDGIVNCVCFNGLIRNNETSCRECSNKIDCNDNGTCTTEYEVAVCECNEGYNGPTCNLVFEEPTCTEDYDCNHPFGWCRTKNTCECMWGFSGTHCYQPWMFTLTVVASGCGLLIIILIVVAVVCGRKGKSSSKKGKNFEKAAPLDDLTNPFTDYQPGIMRAKVPSKSIYSNISDPMPTSSTNGNAATSTFNGNGVQHDYEYDNPAYAVVDKTRRQSSKHKASPRNGNEYF